MLCKGWGRDKRFVKNSRKNLKRHFAWHQQGKGTSADHVLSDLAVRMDTISQSLDLLYMDAQETAHMNGPGLSLAVFDERKKWQDDNIAGNGYMSDILDADTAA